MAAALDLLWDALPPAEREAAVAVALGVQDIQTPLSIVH
jgi:hypothetical protein